MGMHKKGKIKEVQKIQRRALKRIFKLLVSTTYPWMLMRTGIWPADQRIQYATLMLYHNINSGEYRKIKKMLEEQKRNNYSNSFYKKVQQIAKTLEIEVDKETVKKILTWKKEVKQKMMLNVNK